VTVPVTKFETNDTAARAVLNYVNAIRPGLCARPFSQYQPEFSRWWLVPGRDWPACRHSKFSIRRSAQGEMCVGFYTEKGLDPSLAGMPGVQRSQIIREDWYWYQFLRHAREGLLDSVADEVVNRSGCTIRLNLEIYGFNSIPAPGIPATPDDFAQLKKEPSAPGYITEIPGLRTLLRFNNCSSIQEVAEYLQTDSGLRFFWIDFHIEVQLAYGSETAGSWGAAEIWQNALAPWSSWVQ
jgi:hypothetical protein